MDDFSSSNLISANFTEYYLWFANDVKFVKSFTLSAPVQGNFSPTDMFASRYHISVGPELLPARTRRLDCVTSCNASQTMSSNLFTLKNLSRANSVLKCGILIFSWIVGHFISWFMFCNRLCPSKHVRHRIGGLSALLRKATMSSSPALSNSWSRRMMVLLTSCAHDVP